jgi:hypothetical protein
MPKRLHVSAVLLFAALLWGVLLIASGLPVTPAYLRPISTVVGAVVALVAAFDLWLWRVPVLQGWFVKRPHLWGTWRVTFQSDWIDRETGERIGPRTGYAIIDQTYTRTSLRLLTGESTSELLVDDIVLAPDGVFKLFGVYRNEPKVAVRHRSGMHYGALALTIATEPLLRLEGTYWTDRQTRGDLTFTDRKPEKHDSFESARLAFGD